MLLESRARANAGKLNTQGRVGRGGHRARGGGGGDVRSTRAVGAQTQVGREAWEILYRASTLTQPVALQASAAGRQSAEARGARRARGGRGARRAWARGGSDAVRSLAHWGAAASGNKALDPHSRDDGLVCTPSLSSLRATDTE